MTREIGAIYNSTCCSFTVWAPQKTNVTLSIVHPYTLSVEMDKDDDGYFSAVVQGLPAGSKYFYSPDGKKQYPDPASCSQPEGVHGPSEVVDQSFDWTDTDWRNIPLKDYIIYELHIGTFTPEGTFEAAISRLDDLADLGINAIEIMPVAQFPGKRNWGYDGVYPYAPQNSYGGYRGLRQLVNACHTKGIAVILDVVYNHLGPEGNYFGKYGPYFTDAYRTPWGDAINYDRTWCDGVRNFFCNNALYWMRHFHIDALRLDAIHEMYDFGAVHFWEYLYNNVKQFAEMQGRHYYLIAESDLNNPEIVKHPESGGYGFSAQWLDDFHHALYVLLDEKNLHRYSDFGSIEQLAKAYTDGFVHSGEYVTFRNKKFGKSSAGIPGDRFIVFNQNHDQVGNTKDGSRLSAGVTLAHLKVAAAAMLLSPYIPMLFMGEEYGEDAPFCYFIDHSDPVLIKAVRTGRKKEFEKDNGDTEPPDPASENIFVQSKIDWEKRNYSNYGVLLSWYKDIISLRKSNPAMQSMDKNDVKAQILAPKAFVLYRRSEDGKHFVLLIVNLSGGIISYEPLYPDLKKILDTTPSGQNSKATSYPLVMGKESLRVPPVSAAVYINDV